MVRLDRFFCNEEWDLTFVHHILHALSTGTSDHCPLLLSNPAGLRRPRTFKFENFWTRLLGFKAEVQNTWNQSTMHHEPFHRLADKLSRTAMSLKRWAKGICSEAKIKYHMALDIIQRLDVAQERRELTQAEYRLRLGLKRRLFGFAVIERAWKKQAARLTNIKEGDANTKYFHRRINARKRKNHIFRLRKQNGWAVTHTEKEHTIAEHFRQVMGRPEPRECDLNCQSLGLTPVDLSGLDDPFTKTEIHKALSEMPVDKAPRPDGFTGKFFKHCWDIIKSDVVAVFNALHDMRHTHFNLLNSANVVLIPKMDGTEGIGDYRPISLIHGFAKLFSKVLAIRLRPLMHSLIPTNQSAFIRERSIHDNFMYVRNMVRKHHRTRRLIHLFKLDISKAFDSVRWDYLLTLLQNRGFPQRWREWIAGLLSTSTSKIILNGTPGEAIRHGKGLRQGDPLSPLLFNLAIDPLQRLLDKATDLGAISKLRGRVICFRTSMYADDAVVFINPQKEDVRVFTDLLRRFGQVSGLCTNLQKSHVVPIRCDNLDLDDILDGIPVTRANLPMKYLGLPLTTARLRRVDLQPLFDKSMNRIAGWRGRHIGLAGRSTLVKSVLTSQPVFLLTGLKASKESLEALDKQRRKFLWAGGEALTGGKCKINWTRTCLPTGFGGLGILNLEKFARALRLRWLWQEWKSPEKAWVGSGTPCDDTDKLLFAAATSITIGNGATVSFWESAWWQGRRMKDVAPLVYAVSKKKNSTLQHALQSDQWLLDLGLPTDVGWTIELIDQLVTVWSAIQTIELTEHEDDQISWKLTSHGQYTAASAYNAQLLGTTTNNFNNLIWKP